MRERWLDKVRVEIVPMANNLFASVLEGRSAVIRTVMHHCVHGINQGEYARPQRNF